MDNLVNIFLASVFIVVILPLIISGIIYNVNFGKTFERMAVDSKELEEYPGLKVDRRSFKSSKDYAMAGFLYTGDYEAPKGIVVLAHGYGTGGHSYYLDVINHLVKGGYGVFTYDASGNGENAGRKVGGFPRGIVDLDNAIKYVKTNEDLKDLPIMLWGHSWGGYSVGSVLKEHPDVRSVISVAGVNSSKLILEDEGRSLYGGLVDVILPYIVAFERIKFGRYSGYNALKGLKHSEAPVMIIHSTDDETVPMERGYELYHDKFKDKSGYEFIKLHHRGHNNPYYTDEAIKYRAEADAAYEVYIKENNLEDNNEIKNKFYEENYSREKLFELDIPLMDRMVDFYDRNLYPKVEEVIAVEPEIEEKVVTEDE